jgi:hypothetical protein
VCSCFFTLIRICEETFNRHTKLLLSNQLTETTYISIVLSMSSHIIISACCKLAHLIIKKFLNIRSTSLANHITENLQHKLVYFAPTLEMSPVISTEQSYLTILTITVQPINNRQTPLGTRIESTLFNILILV